jgi:hypothetical protein
MANEKTGSVSVTVPGVDFAEMAKAAIAGQLTQAMVATPAMIETIVAAALTRKVDEHGNNPRYAHDAKTPFVQWVCEDMIRAVTLEVFKAQVEAMRPQIEKAVVAEMKKSGPAIAKALVSAYVVESGQRYNTTVSFNLKPRD